MKAEKKGSTSAKILYRPVGMVSSIVAGLAASALFRWAWKRAAHGDAEDPPSALETEYPLKEILAAAVAQGAIYALVKALTDRGGARAFQRLTGEWPGD